MLAMYSVVRNKARAYTNIHGRRGGSNASQSDHIRQNNFIGDSQKTDGNNVSNSTSHDSQPGSPEQPITSPRPFFGRSKSLNSSKKNKPPVYSQEYVETVKFLNQEWDGLAQETVYYGDSSFKKSCNGDHAAQDKQQLLNFVYWVSQRLHKKMTEC